VQVVEAPEFEDVTLDFWGYEAIGDFARKGYVTGDGNGRFRANDNITRAEFLKILLTASEIEIKEYDIPFADVPENSWYFGYVATANRLGIANGISAELFAPGNDITREDMAVLIFRTANMADAKTEGSPDGRFSDSDEISQYAKTAVEALASSGVINGNPDGSFAPKANATRAEAVQMLYNLLKLR